MDGISRHMQEIINLVISVICDIIRCSYNKKREVC